MSVVAVKINPDTIDLCSDSFIGDRSQQAKMLFAKSFQVNGITIGGAGSAEETSLLKIFCQNHSPAAVDEDDVIDFFVEFIEWKKKKIPSHLVRYPRRRGGKPNPGVLSRIWGLIRKQRANATLMNYYLLVYRGKVFDINDLYVREITTYWALGAGETYAKAALHLGHSAFEAVQVACELSPWCETPINTITIEKGENKITTL